MKDAAKIQDEDAEVSSSMEDELLSDQGQDDLKPMRGERYQSLLSKHDQEDLEPMPMDQYFKLRFRLLTKSCPRNMGQMVLMVSVFMACGMLVAFAAHESRKASVNLRVPQPDSQAPGHNVAFARHTSPPTTPAPIQQKPIGCNYKEMAACSARSLFQNSEIHRVVTDNIMRINSRVLTQADYEIVQEFAWGGFTKINAELEARAPLLANELGFVQLSEAEKNAVLDVLSRLSDPSVQKAGYDVAMVIRNSKFTTPKFLKRNIENSLDSISEFQKLAHEIIPKSVIALWAKGGHEWEMTLEPQNIKSMRMDHMKLLDNISQVDFETKSVAIYASVLQIGRVLLDIMKIHIRSIGPSWTTALHDTIELLMKGEAMPTQNDKRIFVEAFLWPLKCGAQGLDVLRASLNQEYGKEFIYEYKGHELLIGKQHH